MVTSTNPEPESAHDRARLLDLIHGYRATCIVAAAVELGVVDARDRASEAQLRYTRAMSRYAGGPWAQRFVLVRTGEGSDPRRDRAHARGHPHTGERP
jgi:hypothetical protein